MIDWASRPYGKNSWSAKPSAVIGTTPGATGTAAAQNSLKGLLTVVDTVLMGQPEVYFTYKPELFDADGSVVDASTRNFLTAWVDRFSAWIERTSERKTQDQAGPAR